MPTSARYATAWLDHGVDPKDKDYEYAIIVGKPSNFVRVIEDCSLLFICQFLLHVQRSVLVTRTCGEGTRGAWDEDLRGIFTGRAD